MTSQMQAEERCYSTCDIVDEEEPITFWVYKKNYR